MHETNLQHHPCCRTTFPTAEIIRVRVWFLLNHAYVPFLLPPATIQVHTEILLLKTILLQVLFPDREETHTNKRLQKV